jgi:CRP-like cAMP-binding protein
MGGSNVELLRRHPLLARLNDEQLQRFARAGELELFRSGEDIVVAGTLGDSFYMILSGSARVYPNPKGTGTPLATLEAPEFFGEMSLIEPALRSATVRAAELTEVFRVPHYAMANLLQDDPPAMNLLLVTIVRVLSARLRQTNQLVGSVKELSAFLAGSLV